MTQGYPSERGTRGAQPGTLPSAAFLCSWPRVNHGSGDASGAGQEGPQNIGHTRHRAG